MPIQSGMKRTITKLGKLLDKPSGMTHTEEFWNGIYSTENFVNWPFNLYPLIMYSSTDHAPSDNAGIWVRVYDPLLGLVTDGSAWVEWQVVSGLSVFDHIVKKTNPIISDANRQTETPQLLEHDGTLYMYYHNNSDDGLTDLPTQASFYVTGTNGIDFGARTIADFAYNRQERTGEGHTGYPDVGLNKIDTIPYKFVGRCLWGGAGDTANNGQMIIGSNDAVNWDELGFWRRINQDLIQFNRAGESDHVYPILNLFNVRKEGKYYRALTGYSPPTSGDVGSGRKFCEVLFNDEFRPVAEPNFLIELGDVGEFDESEINTFCEFEYGGVNYITYKTTQSNDLSAIGIALVEDVPHDWNIFYPYEGKVEVLASVSTPIATAPNFTFTGSTSLKTEAERDLTTMVIPVNQDEVFATGTVGIDLQANDITIAMFDRIGKDTHEPMFVEFGLTDSLSSQTIKLAIGWNARTGGNSNFQTEDMIARRLGTSTASSVRFPQRIGMSSNFAATQGDESPTAKHTLGLRIIPDENKLSIMSGLVSLLDLDITGLDYSVPLVPYIRARFTTAEQVSDGGFSFHSFKVTGYSNQQEVNMSTANVRFKDITDGSHPVKIYNDTTNDVLFDDDLVFTNKVASTEVVGAVGVVCIADWLGSTPPNTGSSKYIITV